MKYSITLTSDPMGLEILNRCKHENIFTELWHWVQGLCIDKMKFEEYLCPPGSFPLNDNYRKHVLKIRFSAVEFKQDDDLKIELKYQRETMAKAIDRLMVMNNNYMQVDLYMKLNGQEVK